MTAPYIPETGPIPCRCDHCGKVAYLEAEDPATPVTSDDDALPPDAIVPRGWLFAPLTSPPYKTGKTYHTDYRTHVITIDEGESAEDGELTGDYITLCSVACLLSLQWTENLGNGLTRVHTAARNPPRPPRRTWREVRDDFALAPEEARPATTDMVACSHLGCIRPAGHTGDHTHSQTHDWAPTPQSVEPGPAASASARCPECGGIDDHMFDCQSLGKKETP